jgi:hypothetical protein
LPQWVVTEQGKNALGKWDLNGEAVDIAEFVYANRDGLHPDDIREILSLQVGETFHGGGGACPEWSITREEG